MDRPDIKKEVIEFLEGGVALREIETYLKAWEIPQEEINLIIESCKAEVLEKEIKKGSKENKRKYYLWLSSAIGTFLLFLIALPYLDTVGYTFILSVIGAFACCFFSFHALFYYKTWTPEYIKKRGRPYIKYNFLFAFLVPGVVLYFIFSYRFSSAQESVLKNTQQEAVGHIITGSTTEIKRLRGGSIEYAVLVVEFETKEGQKVTARKEIPASKFGNFYLGQEVNLIYSKVNPQNIDLLVDEASLREFKNTQEREFDPADLMRLIAVKQADMTNALNKINYGWVYDQGKNVWVNEKRQSAVAASQNGLRLIGNHDYNFSFPQYLTGNGFTKTSKDDPDDLFQTGKKIFENDKFIISVEANQDNAIISIVRK